MASPARPEEGRDYREPVTELEGLEAEETVRYQETQKGKGRENDNGQILEMLKSTVSILKKKNMYIPGPEKKIYI